MAKRTLHSFYSSDTHSIPRTTDNSNEPKKARMDFNPDDIIVDPAKCVPIDKYDNSIRDEVRCAYLLRGPTQPKDHEFPRKMQNGCPRSFQKAWFDRFDWLEYSVEKDAAFCFYCFCRYIQIGVPPARVSRY
jgi:hypothetical protein